MHFIYIDDSTDRPTHVFSAICIPCDKWNDAFNYVRDWRKSLRDNYGIPVSFELHATEFLTGRGSKKKIGNLTRHQRSKIFHSGFSVIESLHEKFGVSVFSVCNADDNQMNAFKMMITRIDRTMSERGSFCHLICDQGKDAQYTALVRKLRVYNPIQSKYGAWEDGSPYKNFPTTRIIEDPQFRDSKTSHFIQIADFVAYGLLRSEKPTPRVKKHGIHKSFLSLKNSTVKACNRNDPKGLGIIRS